MGSRLIKLVSEAKRRRVFRTTGVYLVGVWAISQGAIELAGLFEVPNWVLRALLIGAIAFTPVVVILAWMFDIRLSGIVRDARDVEEQAREQEIAELQTAIGGRSEQGSVAVHWRDDAGDHRAVFSDDFFVGRAQDCRVRFYDPLVSRQHLKVFCADGFWQMQDLGSRNGTTVDGRRIETIALGSRTRVRVNEAGPVLRFEVIPPGDGTTIALAESVDSTGVAHVRTTTMQAGKTAEARRTGA